MAQWVGAPGARLPVSLGTGAPLPPGTPAGVTSETAAGEGTGPALGCGPQVSAPRDPPRQSWPALSQRSVCATLSRHGGSHRCPPPPGPSTGLTAAVLGTALACLWGHRHRHESGLGAGRGQGAGLTPAAQGPSAALTGTLLAVDVDGVARLQGRHA